MSITFYIANQQPDGYLRYAYRCDCSERWCDACDAAWEQGKDSPPMYTCDNCTDVDMNLANLNAREFMDWIGISALDSIPAKDLAVLCRRRLWDEDRNHDPAIPSEERAKQYGLDGNPRVIFGERAEDYLRSKTAIMLRICEKAGDRLITWA